MCFQFMKFKQTNSVLERSHAEGFEKFTIFLPHETASECCTHDGNCSHLWEIKIFRKKLFDKFANNSDYFWI